MSMSTILPSNRKTKKFLSIVYGNRQGPKESGFLRSYSQYIFMLMQIDNQAFWPVSKIKLWTEEVNGKFPQQKNQKK